MKKLLCAGAILLAACAPATILQPRPRAVSQPAPVNVTDDAAFWVHPTDPASSLLLVANKGRGLEVHDLDGFLRKQLGDAAECKAVDVMYGFPLAKGPADVVLVAGDAPDPVLFVYRVDPVKRKLTALGLPVKFPAGDPPVSVCGYTGSGGARYVFLSREQGQLEQYALAAAGDGVALRPVRALARTNKIKGLVADDARGVLFFADEKAGVFALPAEPDGPATPTLVAAVETHGLKPEVKGLALYGAADRGYLLVSCAGTKSDTTRINVYDRRPPYTFRATIEPRDATGKPLRQAAGIAVTHRPTSADFPLGVLAVNDHGTANGSFDFKLYPWETIARPAHLLIDPSPER
jgi:3-phytase